jgi:threonine/homoserine/homoserine lactone efflux protein
VIKVVGAIVLVIMGARSLLGSGHRAAEAGSPMPVPVSDRRALRDGLITSLANPKLAVFFVALFPQFVPRGTPVLPAALAMVGAG